MTFKIITSQEVYISFKDTDADIDVKTRIEDVIMHHMQKEYPNIGIVRSAAYWFNFTLRTRTEDGTILSVGSYEMAYNTLVRKAQSEGLVLE